MQLRRLRLKLHRKLKRSQKQAEVLSTQAEQNIDRHLFKRFGTERRPSIRYKLASLDANNYRFISRADYCLERSVPECRACSW